MNKYSLQRILYVDNDDIRAVAGIALEAVGGLMRCLCASGQEALAEAEKFSPDFILLDVMMPGMDGSATLAALRRIDTLGATPVIFMTAKAQSAEIGHYRELGAIAVITKPFQAMQLVEQLREIWKGL